MIIPRLLTRYASLNHCGAHLKEPNNAGLESRWNLLKTISGPRLFRRNSHQRCVVHLVSKCEVVKSGRFRDELTYRHLRSPYTMCGIRIMELILYGDLNYFEVVEDPIVPPVSTVRVFERSWPIRKSNLTIPRAVRVDHWFRCPSNYKVGFFRNEAQ